MNAAARAVARTALYEGVRVWGINDGYQGLLDEDMWELESKDVGDIIQRPTLRDGYIKANGATVKASEYPRLLAWVQESNMTVTTRRKAVITHGGFFCAWKGDAD